MDSVPANAAFGPVPQHSRFSFSEDGIVFTSQFDSGNMQKVEKTGPGCFSIWTGPDCMGTACENTCRTWFYYKVQAPLGVMLNFTIKNLNLQGKLFREGMKPTVKDEGDWVRIETPLNYKVTGEVCSFFEVSFSHVFRTNEASFAFTFPWSYEENQIFFDGIYDSLKVRDYIYVHKENLINSIENRRVDIYTISSYDNITTETEKTIPHLFPNNSTEPRPLKFLPAKKLVLITSRVHPGETAGSYMMNGFLKFLISEDPRAVLLRKNFVFKLVPMLNPDGVFRGHYRTDTNGVNLNRVYLNPSLSEYPTIYAIKEYILDITKDDPNKLYLYIDLHGHASKRGCFMYGNYMDFIREVESMLFAKLMALNCINFDFEGSSFSEKNMAAKDKRDGMSKEGCGRVAVFKFTNLVRCYTLECNYNSGRSINKIEPIDLDNYPEALNSSSIYANGPPPYTVEVFEDVGKAIGVSLLDSIEQNSFSRIPLTEMKDLNGVRFKVGEYVAGLIPFRFDTQIKKLKKNKEEFIQYILAGGKTAKQLEERKNNERVSSKTIKKPDDDKVAQRPPRPRLREKTQSEKVRISNHHLKSSSSSGESASSAHTPSAESEHKSKEVSVVPVKHYVFPKPPKSEGGYKNPSTPKNKAIIKKRKNPVANNREPRSTSMKRKDKSSGRSHSADPKLVVEPQAAVSQANNV
jgi:hypothetical protein